jgi:D-alanyl-D-alanine carboxypeptidase/D-alanyl-D-alanine-endopeptidase (penicillin-binding protein 4)
VATGVPFDNPPADAAALFTGLLVARGVDVAGSPVSGAAPRGAAEIAAIDSPPVGDLVHAMLRDSDNGTAELLLKELGVQRLGDGSTAAGTRTVRELLERDGIPFDVGTQRRRRPHLPRCHGAARRAVCRPRRLRRQHQRHD